MLEETIRLGGNMEFEVHRQVPITYSNAMTSLIHPKFIQLRPNPYALAFYVMKILPAYYSIEKAINAGKIDRNTEIIETSSGSFAYGIALTCNALKLRYHIITDEYMDQVLQTRIRLLGGNLHFAAPEPGESSQAARLALLERVKAQLQRSFWTSQYDNLDNTRSYQFIGQYLEKILSNPLGANCTLVGPVGSGGSTCGISKYMRAVGMQVELVGVDCFNSILFGLSPGRRRLGGFGNGIIPKNLDHTAFDQVHWLSDEYCIAGMQTLYKTYSLFSGHTTGAAYLVADYLAKQNPQKKVIFISPDSGHRYAATYYNHTWLADNEYCLPSCWSEPIIVSTPEEAVEPWSSIYWERRKLKK